MVYNPYTNPDEFNYGNHDEDYQSFIRELSSEIRRHHEDFEKIRAILDEWELVETPSEGRWVLKEIRNIVG
jgi:hypothetical protein